MTSPPNPPDPAALPRHEAHVPPALAAEWRRAEGALLSSAMRWPEVYQRVLLAVAGVLDQLRALGPSTPALLTAVGSSRELVGKVLTARSLNPAELDVNAVARTALAIRHREIIDEQAALGRLAALAAARRAGRSWVVLEEHGDPEGDPLVPYHRLEAEASTGRALLVTARPDEQFRGSRHAVEPVQVDLDSGWVKPAQDGNNHSVDRAGRQAREEYVATLKGEVFHP